MEKIRLLHKKQAGRETRSNETWKIQYDAIKTKEEFLHMWLS